jgi:transcriptional regulator with PAS, ATPase and Fis domain
MNKRIVSVSPEIMDLFMHYDFPGNIRELENAIEHAFVICRTSQIKPDHLPGELIDRARQTAIPSSALKDPLKAAEMQTVLQVLAKHGGNRKKAAEELGISVVTLWRKLKKLEVGNY